MITNSSADLLGCSAASATANSPSSYADKGAIGTLVRLFSVAGREPETLSPSASRIPTSNLPSPPRFVSDSSPKNAKPSEVEFHRDDGHPSTSSSHLQVGSFPQTVLGLTAHLSASLGSLPGLHRDPVESQITDYSPPPVSTKLIQSSAPAEALSQAPGSSSRAIAMQSS
ncbi:hypothetical protein CABS01_14921 [Colletotrichum abscissum]|uniref:Uncharacterized protein n=1 Tax=Colletotrichum abscissum TaxID=1671311 RepID=A0A9Q0B184_9PEZI|nr:uncharacterized protein CABS01_14921 [Colletotrichum abscissum]KAI3543407.1 hypothetical protein CABS02_10010 [Colletotrichum abscissum]KAK1477454.1 hypothetical protein CABS01_14921 [Colletotrichum abscissum]